MATKSSPEPPAEGLESDERKIGRTTLIRLSLYYIVVSVIVAGFIVLNDGMKAMQESHAARPTELSSQRLAPLFQSLPPLATGAAAVIGAFLLALPVAFVYVRTRNRLKYDQSLVQTVIMLPVVIASILIVVQNSLALAFSLAGIVAAVRFRNNLKDSRDAVYIFAAVGIGFAAGVGQLAIATFLSLFFCLLELILWKLDLTAEHEQTFGMVWRSGPGPVHEIPKGMASLGLSGDASAASPSANTPLLALGGADPALDEKPKKAFEKLLLYVTEPEKARPLVEGILAETTKEFKHRKTRSSGVNQYRLEYQVRLKKKAPLKEIIDRLHEEGGGYLITAEAAEE